MNTGTYLSVSLPTNTGTYLSVSFTLVPKDASFEDRIKSYNFLLRVEDFPSTRRPGYSVEDFPSTRRPGYSMRTFCSNNSPTSLLKRAGLTSQIR
eukprot:g24525.t1